MRRKLQDTHEKCCDMLLCRGAVIGNPWTVRANRSIRSNIEANKRKLLLLNENLLRCTLVTG